MKLTLKPLPEQTIVITGASSGIGLVTARLAAQRGARLVLAARNTEAIEQLAREIRAQGGQAEAVTTDVGRPEDIRRLADRAEQRYGGFDTWVNNAGVSIYGRILDVDIEDMRQLFETNVWGVVHGSRVAAEHLKTRGGAIINIGSTLSERAIPLQGIYCASKFAVKGFTDALRMELEHDHLPISVTLIKPAAIDTPYTEHAKNYLPGAPQNPPPVYPPEAVAEAILYCAETPTRDLFVGGAGKLFSAAESLLPRWTDKLMEAMLVRQQQSGKPAAPREANALYAGGGTLQERGAYGGYVTRTSLYTQAAMNPVATGLAAAGAGFLIAALLRQRDRSRTQ